LSFINKLAPHCNCARELTVEANSESLLADFVYFCIEGGATRLSIGVQTLDDPSRLAVGRIGSAKEIKHNLRILHNIHNIDISFDLISGLPGVSKTILQNDIDTLLEYNPVHISLYDLTIEDGTPLAAATTTILPTPEDADELWLYGHDYLKSKGFTQYEVSNFARGIDKQCKHNMRYWLMQSWIASGTSASGTIVDDETGNAIRYTITKEQRAESREQRIWDWDFEKIDRAALLKETIMMGYRTIYGPDENLFQKRFGKTIEQSIPNTITRWREKKLYSLTTNALTQDGILFLNRFLSDCMGELDINH
jgi:oxygen-independent coproporphyrinogen-3 oxidase